MAGKTVAVARLEPASNELVCGEEKTDFPGEPTLLPEIDS